MSNHFLKINRKYFFGFFLFIQILLNSVNDSFIVGLFFVYILGTIVYTLNYRLRISKVLFVLLLIVMMYTIYGYNNGGWLQDTRHNISWLLALIFLLDILKKIEFKDAIKIIFAINIILFLIYLALNFGLRISLFESSDVPAYMDYRNFGPPLYTYYIIPFIYLVSNRVPDQILLLNGIFGAIAILINGSAQSFGILGMLYAVVYIDLSNSTHIKRSLAGILIFIIVIGIYFNKWADPRLQEKIGNIFTPLETSTVQTRILDLSYVLNQSRDFKENAIGHGIGKRSTVYRVNPQSPSLSSYRTFLEIDNGIYYIFNRYGLIGIIFLIVSHIYLMKNMYSKKAQLAFVIMFFSINLLSIHYWTYYQGALIIAIIKSNKFKRKNGKIIR